MDINDPNSFNTVTKAIAFSPYMQANLHENTRIAKMLGSNLMLIHIGDMNKKKEEVNRVIEGPGFEISSSDEATSAGLE